MLLAAAGLYVPSWEPAHPGHELTQRIVDSKRSREHDPLLAQLLAATAVRHFPTFSPDLVVSLPPKPGHDDRFRNLRRELAARLGAADGRGALTQTRISLDYRRMGATERLAMADGSYLAATAVRGRSVLLIDDVVTTGAQTGDGTRALRAAGAADVRIACVARTIDPHEHSRLTVRSHWPPRRAAAGHPHTIRAWPIESSSKWSP